MAFARGITLRQPQFRTPLTLSEGCFVAAQQLSGEVIEEGGVVDEIAAEHSTGLFQESIEPFHAYQLNPFWRAADVSGLEVDCGAKGHPNFHSGHKVAVIEYPFFLFGSTQTHQHHIGSGTVYNVDYTVGFRGCFLKAVRGRV